MCTLQTKFNVKCLETQLQPNPICSEQSRKTSADGTGTQGLQSLTDLRVEGRRRCARAADKLHKEGPVLKSEEEAVAAAGARGRRSGMRASGEPSGEGQGYERKKNRNKEGRRETRAHEENGEKKRGKEIHPGRQSPSAKREQELTPGAECPVVWGQAPGLEGGSKCPGVSSEPGLDAWPSHITLNSLQTYAKGHGKRQRGVWQGSLPGLRVPGEQQPSWRDAPRLEVFNSVCP